MAANSVASPSVSASEIVAYELDQNRTPQSLSSKSPLELAYGLVQRGFFLSDTPWLGCTSSERLGTIRTGDRGLYLPKVNITLLAES